MNESWPASSVTGDPDTGASSRSAPRDATSAAMARTASGLTVLISTCTVPRRSRASSRLGVGDGDRADLELAPRVRRQTRDLDGRRGGKVAAEVPRPHAVEGVLLAEVGEISGGRDEIAERAAGGLERLPEVLHRAHRLLFHRP